jgi:hypothetical protein
MKQPHLLGYQCAFIFRYAKLHLYRAPATADHARSARRFLPAVVALILHAVTLLSTAFSQKGLGLSQQVKPQRRKAGGRREREAIFSKWVPSPYAC